MTSPHAVGGFHSSHWERLLRLEWHPQSQTQRTSESYREKVMGTWKIPQKFFYIPQKFFLNYILTSLFVTSVG